MQIRRGGWEGELASQAGQGPGQKVKGTVWAEPWPLIFLCSKVHWSIAGKEGGWERELAGQASQESWQEELGKRADRPGKPETWSNISRRVDERRKLAWR